MRYYYALSRLSSGKLLVFRFVCKKFRAQWVQVGPNRKVIGSVNHLVADARRKDSFSHTFEEKL